MTRARTPRIQAPPLTDTLRATLTQGWHSLAALDALAAPARGSDARRAVHEALRALRAEGVALEERVATTGVEVRLGAPRCALSPEQVEEMGGPEGVAATAGEAVDLPVGDEPDDYTRFHDALAAGPVEADGDAYSDGIAPLSPEAMAVFVDLVEHPPAPTEALRALYAGAPGPSSRCAVCSAPHARHAPDDGHAFAPKPRGRPRVAATPIPNAAPAVLPRARQRRERGPVVDVDGGRVERAPPALDTRGQPSPEERGAVARIEAIAHAGMGRCRPPACHRDDIHEPSRLRGFARPLCEAHRRWVEEAGGTLAAGGLAGVVRAP